MAGITWLHLSDWHQGAEEELRDKHYVHFNRDVVRKALIEDIQNREKIGPKLSQVDFIVFSGDVAFSGKKEQYEKAWDDLFSKILDATNLASDQLFIVPGNHDFDGSIFDLLPPELQKPFADEFQLQKWLTTDRMRDRLLEPFESFKTFVVEKTKQTQPDYANTRLLDIHGKQVALLGINSALMARRHKENDKFNDETYLVVGEPQIDRPLDEIQTYDVRIAVLHHPLEWLSEFDRNRVKPLLKDRCHFILCGHEHRTQVEQVVGSEGECIIIPAGASFDRRDYPNGYNFVHLDFKRGRGEVYLRRWSDRRRKWIRDEDACDRGKYTFDLPKNLRQERIESTDTTVGPTTSIDLEIHYDELFSKITSGLVVPFLGADVNLCDRQSGSRLWTPDSNYPPSSIELARYLDDEICKGKYLLEMYCPLCEPGELLPDECPIVKGIVTRMDLQHVSQYAKTIRDLDALKDAISKVYYNKSYTPNRLHKLLAKLPRRMKETGYTKKLQDRLQEGDFTLYPLIVTTNFDNTLEKAFIDAKQEFDLVVYMGSQKIFFHQKFRHQNERDVNTPIVEQVPQPIKAETAESYYGLSLDECPVILKLYGPPDWINNNQANFTITEDQFINYLVRYEIGNLIPPALLNKLRNSCLWFLGYSLNYWNLRVILNRIWPEGIPQPPKEKPWWAVQEKPGHFDADLWQENDVRLICVRSLDDYVTGLEKKVEKL